MKTITIPPAPACTTGIDYHKRYSVYRVPDAGGTIMERGGIEHSTPEAFAALLS
jgi:hypothetical protein